MLEIYRIVIRKRKSGRPVKNKMNLRHSPVSPFYALSPFPFWSLSVSVLFQATLFLLFSSLPFLSFATKPHPLQKLFFKSCFHFTLVHGCLYILKLCYIIKKGKFSFPWLQLWVLVGFWAASPGHPGILTECWERVGRGGLGLTWRLT